jgi:hypothetical protein
MSDEPDLLPPRSREPADAVVEVETLPIALADAPLAMSVTLGGEAARNVRDSLGTALVGTARTGHRAANAAGAAYRLVPSEQAAKGLADGSLRWATASKGDASVLIKDSATGRIAGRGELAKVSPSPAKILGPAVWEAMAVATQQHYLVEINEKLQSIERGVSEALSQMDGDKRGTLTQLRKVAANSKQRLDSGRSLSDARVRELQDGAQRADEVWHQLHDRMTRHLGEYRAGQRKAGEVENSWAMLLYATHVLAENSAVLSALTYDSVAALEDASSEERERVLHALEQVRSLAGELLEAHLNWAAENAEWQFARTRNPARKAVRAVRKTNVPRPSQKPLDYTTAWRASQLALPPQPPGALVVTVSDDGTVAVGAERS